MGRLLVDSSPISKAMILVRDFCGLQSIQVANADSQQGLCLLNGSNSFHSVMAITKSFVHLSNRTGLLGKSQEDLAFVEQWLTIATRLFLSNAKSLPEKMLLSLNSQLLSSTYLVSNKITIADVVLYAALHLNMKSIIDQTQKDGALMNLSRWFDHVHHMCAQSNASLSEIPFYIPSTIFTSDFSKSLGSGNKSKKGKDKNQKKDEGKNKQSKQDQGKNKQSKQDQGKNKQSKQDKGKNKGKGAKPQKEQNKKDKKEKKKKPQKAKAGGPDNSWRLNVLVGKIKSARKHKTEGDKMFVSEIDCGEEKCRTVVMGVASFCKEEDLKGRIVMVIINVKPADVKGEFSNGRVLCATSSDKTTKEIVNVPDGAKIGERIKCGDSDKKPDAAISNKNMHKILKKLNTSNKGVAQYADKEFLTSAGPCIAPSILEGTMA